jgi:hypothetical protein
VSYLVSSAAGLAGSVIATMGFLTCAALPVASQNKRGSCSDAMVTVSAAASPCATQEIVREIDDPATGGRWMLMRDAGNPGGPGRMVLLAQGTPSPTTARAPVEYAGSNFDRTVSAALIHAGDHLIVEEHTRLIDASLDAVALAPAREGQTLRVRLSISGHVVKAVAAAAGRATLIADSGV